MSKNKYIYLGSFVLILFVIYGIFTTGISIHEEFPAEIGRASCRERV